MSLIGYRIFERTQVVLPPGLLQQFASIGSAQISDCMNRLYGVVGLKPMHATSGSRLVGVALTVKTRPGDNLLVHKAILMGQPGDIVVMDGGGETTNALVGELMAMDAQQRGIAGFVVDGAVRDADFFAQNNFPCFARAISHRGPYKDGPGEVNVPVSIGGQVVCAGDVIVGDADGLVVIPASYAAEVLAAALKKEAAEVVIKQKIAAGNYVKAWVDSTIAEKKGAM